ncbi:MAG: triple tyrosine motif-containing protein [Bacteroidota bacterium]
MKFISPFITLMLLSQFLMAQSGDVVLNHYDVPLPPQDYLYQDMDIDNQGRLLLAYKKGILQFDGNSWVKVKVNSSPIKFLEVNNKHILLAKNGIYEIGEDQFHSNKLELLYQTPLLSPIVDLIYFENQYYLLANEKITVFSEGFEKLNTFDSKLGFKDIFVFDEKLYAFEDNYLVENVEETWVDLNLFAPENTDFVFSIKGEEQLYFSYDNGDFYAFNGKEFTPYSSEVNEYLRENYPISGKYFDGKIIISTLIGGVVLVEEKSGEIISTIQNYNGLPTNEVNAITMDQQKGLWLAHPYGLSRAALEIPLKDFQFYPGLEGLPETITMSGDTLWVGTTEGLFFLKEVKDYETLQKKMVQKVKINRPNEPELNKDEEDEGFFQNLFSSNDSEEQKFIDEELKKYRKIYRNDGIRFRALREKLDEKEKELRDSIQNARQNNSKPKSQNGRSKKGATQYKSVVKTIDVSRLKSIEFEFQKDKTVAPHVESVIKTDQGIIARSNTGIYIVKKEETMKISDLKMVNKMLYQAEKKVLWLSNNNGLYSIDLKQEDFDIQKHSGNKFHDLMINANQLSAVGENILEIFNITDKGLETLKKLNINNDFSEEMLLFFEDGKVKLLRTDGIMVLDKAESNLKRDSLFDKSLEYFLKDQNEDIWVLNAEEEWFSLQKDISHQLKDWTHIVPSIKSIYNPNDSIVFFVTNERIVRWKYAEEKEYPLPKTFIDGVMVENEWVLETEAIKMEHGQNNLKIILSTPEYLFKDDVVYQYYVKGLMDDWSSWSSIREIDFPYIPTGDYVLEIRAKTFLNDNVRSFDFEFEVLPPYWQTWWFYMLEIAFFSILILISIKLNTTNQSSYLTKTFTFLTLILFLEFLATILENNLEGYVDDSPVYTFVINVVLALSISPIEKGVNKVLVKINSARSKELISRMRAKQKEKKKNE